MLDGLYVLQDGKEFYISHNEKFLFVVSYPGVVHDFDMEAANKARYWFEQVFLPVTSLSLAWSLVL